MTRDRSARKRMQYRALWCLRRLVPGLPERGVRSGGLSVATRYTIDRTETMHARRLLLAALIIPTFTLSARQGGAAPSGATIAAPARNGPGSAEEVSLLAGRFKPHRTQAGSVWIVRADFGGNPKHARAQRMHLTTTHERPPLAARAS